MTNNNPKKESVFFDSDKLVKEKFLAIVWTTDKDLVFTSSSGTGLEKLGLKKDEVVGVKLKDFLEGTDSADEIITNHLLALKGESITYDSIVADNHYLAHVQPAHDSQGKIIGCAGMAIDVSERIKDEIELKESEAIFRELSESTNAAIFIYQNNSILYANPTGLAITGYSDDEIRNLQPVDLIHPDMREMVAERGAQRMAGKPVIQRYELKILTKNGQAKWLDYSGSQILFKGQPAIMGTALDITEKKKIEQALKESEEKFRSIVNTAQEGIWLINGQAVTDYVNERMAQILGYSVDEMIGKSMYYFIDQEGKKIAEENFSKRKDGISEQHEFRFKRKDGSDVWTLLSTNPVTNENGEFIGALAMVSDISERIKTETELEEATAQLKHDGKSLREQNIAMRKVLEHIEEDRREYQHVICEKLDLAIVPAISKLIDEAPEKSKKMMETLLSNVQSILSQDMDIFRGLYEKLTPRELQISKLIRKGHSSKEVSDELSLSVVTINKHREKIRKKLGLTNQNINLSAYLTLHDYTH